MMGTVVRGEVQQLVWCKSSERVISGGERTEVHEQDSWHLYT